MKCKLYWNNINKMIILGITNSGNIITMDGTPYIGGNNLSPRPMELILLGLGGCTLYDIISILKKNKQNIKYCILYINSKRYKKNPKIFKKIHFHFIFYSKKIKNNLINYAIKLSHNKYCSVYIMLKKNLKITYSFNINKYI